MSELSGLDLFSNENYSENKISEIARAELYTRLYKWMAEDFTTVNDVKIFIEALINWANSIENRLSKLGYSLATHTHILPPHTHFGTGPQVDGFITLTPRNSTKLKWKKEKVFDNIKNTTGAKSNFSKNKIIRDRSPSLGDLEYGKTGRELVIPILSGSNYNKTIIRK